MALSALDKKYPRESQHNPAFIPRGEVEYVFDEIAEFVVSATRKNCPETGDMVIAKGECRLTLGDMRGLSYYVRDLTDELFKPKEYRTMHMKHRRPTPVVFNPPVAMQPTGSTTADPITSLNTSPADGPIRFPGFPHRLQRLPGPSMATFVSAENVTEITWFGPISGYPSPDEVEAEEIPLPSPEAREIPAIVVTRPSEEGTGTSAGNRQGTATAEGMTRRPQNSRQVLAAVDEEGEASQLQAQDEPEPPKTILGKMRRKSVELGQTVGGFMNGAYRNSDYKPRRESSALRMRAILDRLSPP
ncbi:hypothetical protein KVR01_005662 [Diaporthe batatas]|uniref:uncharacterized protein n=1 Tax=Diaporthe batatas TaxID=748121 RepID=UPI001D04156B|nr:uncharacterized protein KVR01_005662 [Diaporthe batatas]KAG8165387.1 hypothetical protein KVR01_005662 [Diaporthe batatas]